MNCNVAALPVDYRKSKMGQMRKVIHSVYRKGMQQGGNKARKYPRQLPKAPSPKEWIDVDIESRQTGDDNKE